MRSRQPLNDTWLFWNAERIEDFPHVPDDDYACVTRESEAAEEEDEQAHSRREILAELLLYVGGASAAMAGVALVILIASFLSAYSALSAPSAGRAGMPEQPYLSLQRPAPGAQRRPPRSIVLEPAGSGPVLKGETSPTRSGHYPSAAAAL